MLECGKNLCLVSDQQNMAKVAYEEAYEEGNKKQEKKEEKKRIWQR